MPIGCTRRGTADTPFTCIRRRLNTLVSGEPSTILAHKTFSLLRLPSFCIRTCRDVTVLRRLRQAFKLAKAPSIGSWRCSVAGTPRRSRHEGEGPIGTLVADFDQHLAKVCGLSPATRFYRRRYAREFLEWRFESKRWDLTKLCFADFVDYVKFRAPRLKPASVGVMMTSLRALVRFLEFAGRCRSGLSQDWPRMPNWKHSPPSDVLSARECRDLLQCVDRQRPSGRRDFAILRLMTDLGLRGEEIVELCLEDIDWRAGTLVIRKNKQRRERLLPLPPVVAKAILSYLRKGRPSSSSRRLFLCHRLPVGQPMTPERLRGAVRRIMRRSGLTGGGPHRLRHSFATRLHARGASLKEVADVLGHQDFDTTAIYARVNLSQLRKVALPWPRTCR